MSFFFHSCRFALCGRVSCAALRANFMVLSGRALSDFAHTVTVSEVVV